MTEVKICGITRVEDALLAASLGARYLGFIFVPGTPRQVSSDQARVIAEAVRARFREAVGFVGVFRNDDVAVIREVSAEVELELIQFHGDETDADLRDSGRTAAKVFRIGKELPALDQHPSAAWFLFDTWDAQRDGGTGRSFDWSLLRAWKRTRPFFLSGGLNPENIAEAIAAVDPDAVDVSSGVESAPGVKDPAKLERLFSEVRAADRDRSSRKEEWMEPR